MPRLFTSLVSGLLTATPFVTIFSGIEQLERFELVDA